MPRATVSHDTVRKELKSCPGGYVELRTLSFDEMQTRQEMAARVYQESDAPRRGKRRRKQEPEKIRGYFELMQVATLEFEFRNCIVDHNLYIDDAESELLDFTKPMRQWKLDPKVGMEISKYIADLNEFEEEEEEEEEGDEHPLLGRAFSSSQDEKNMLPTSMENE